MKPTTKLNKWREKEVFYRRITLYEYTELENIISFLKPGKKYETFIKYIADACEECGFTVKEKEIGWVISFDEEA